MNQQMNKPTNKRMNQRTNAPKKEQTNKPNEQMNCDLDVSLGLVDESQNIVPSVRNESFLV